jgi:hypothetical protein
MTGCAGFHLYGLAGNTRDLPPSSILWSCMLLTSLLVERSGGWKTEFRGICLMQVSYVTNSPKSYALDIFQPLLFGWWNFGLPLLGPTCFRRLLGDFTAPSL